MSNLIWIIILVIVLNTALIPLAVSAREITLEDYLGITEEEASAEAIKRELLKKG